MISLAIVWKVISEFVKSIPWQAYAIVAVVLALLLLRHISYRQGQQDVQAKWDAQKAATAEQIRVLQQKAARVNERVVTQVVTRTQVIHEKGDTIIREIPRYIPVGTPDLPSGFRLLHDAAATNTLPGSSSGTTAAPVPVADATSTITKNYTACHIDQEKLAGWQLWYNEQLRLHSQN